MTFTPRAFQKPAPRIEQADVPLATLQQQVAAIVTGQRNAQLLTEAADRTASPSDRLAYQLDAWLVRHPEAPVSTLDDYPDWTPGGAQ